MTNTRDRLIRCFAASFPNLSHDEIVHASPASVASWDSLATVTLFALAEEEFGVNLNIDYLDHTGDSISFEWLLTTLEARSSTSGEQRTWGRYSEQGGVYER